MRHLKSLPLAVALFFLGLANTKAQQTVVSSGGEITSNDGSLSYSVGQLAYTELSSDNGSASEGVQQAMIISVVAGVDHKDINLSDLSSSVYLFSVSRRKGRLKT